MDDSRTWNNSSGDAKVHIISGTHNGNRGAMQGDHVAALYLDVEVKGDGEWSFETEKESTLYIFIK